MEKKKIILGTIIGTSIVTVGYLLYKYLGYQINKPGSDLWFKYSSLDEKKKFREIIGEKFRNAGINNLNDKEYNFVENMKFKLDNVIGTIENAELAKKFPNAHLPTSEHGWYLPEN